MLPSFSVECCLGRKEAPQPHEECACACREVFEPHNESMIFFLQPFMFLNYFTGVIDIGGTSAGASASTTTSFLTPSSISLSIISLALVIN